MVFQLGFVSWMKGGLCGNSLSFRDDRWWYWPSHSYAWRWGKGGEVMAWVARWGCYWCDFHLRNDKALVVWVYIGDYATTWLKALHFIFGPWEPLWTNLTSLQNAMGSFFSFEIGCGEINNSTEVDDRHKIMWRATVETHLFLSDVWTSNFIVWWKHPKATYKMRPNQLWLDFYPL